MTLHVERDDRTDEREEAMQLSITINGDPETLEVDGETDLATALRSAGYTGVKCGCDGGDCGASTVLVDDEPVMACGTSAAAVDEASILTIEGLGTQDDLHPIQRAFVDHFAVQCGFCIPGMILQSKALLEETPDPTPADVRDAIDENLCRCTGYQKPVEAILDAADRMGSERSVAADGGRPASNTADRGRGESDD